MDKLMRLFGFENINNIKIKESFKNNPPKYHKLLEKKIYHMQHNKYEQPIVIDDDNWLIDGYTTYLIEKGFERKYVKVKRRKC